jgi:phage anti-repressor protein
MAQFNNDGRSVEIPKHPDMYEPSESGREFIQMWIEAEPLNE